MDTMGGFVQTVPVHATVVILSFPFPSVTLTMTAGRGYSIFPGFHCCFAMSHLLQRTHKGRYQLLFPGNHARKHAGTFICFHILKSLRHHMAGALSAE